LKLNYQILVFQHSLKKLNNRKNVVMDVFQNYLNKKKKGLIAYKNVVQDSSKAQNIL